MRGICNFGASVKPSPPMNKVLYGWFKMKVNNAAMVPGLVLFKAWQISWKKEQKLGFFPWIKNNLITFHRIFVLILELISKIHKGEMKFSRFCYFWRVILQIMSCLIECFFSCWNWIANTSKFQTEICAFLGTFLFKIQQIFEKRTKFVL